MSIGKVFLLILTIAGGALGVSPLFNASNTNSSPTPTISPLTEVYQFTDLGSRCKQGIDGYKKQFEETKLEFDTLLKKQKNGYWVNSTDKNKAYALTSELENILATMDRLHSCSESVARKQNFTVTELSDINSLVAYATTRKRVQPKEEPQVVEKPVPVYIPQPSSNSSIPKIELPKSTTTRCMDDLNGYSFTCTER